MQAVILAGGLGTRLSEETSVKPKPMVEIGGRPILWHIMKIYSCYGINEFVICCGFKGHVIKQFFAEYCIHVCDITYDLKNQKVFIQNNNIEPWKVTLIDTGEQTATGGRLKRVVDYIRDETFCFTYGDGVADIDINRLISFHREHGTMATLTATQPPGRFGSFTLSADDVRVSTFREKPKGDGAWVNGGFFVLEPEVIKRIDDDSTVWEQRPLQNLAKDGQLAAYRHNGFWQPMDTLRDKTYLEQLWQSGSDPWKVW